MWQFLANFGKKFHVFMDFFSFKKEICDKVFFFQNIFAVICQIFANFIIKSIEL